MSDDKQDPIPQDVIVAALRWDDGRRSGNDLSSRLKVLENFRKEHPPAPPGPPEPTREERQRAYVLEHRARWVERLRAAEAVLEECDRLRAEAKGTAPDCGYGYGDILALAKIMREDEP